MYIESETLELKRQLTDDIIKEIIAFANAKGGRIIIGVDDNGEIVGVDDAKQICEKLSSKINDLIRPSIIALTSISIIEEDDKQLVKVEILRGTNRPYYIASKGIKSTGVFVRFGNTIIPASENLIRNLIKESDNYNYEDMLSFNQELKFDYTRRFFESKGIELEKNNMKTLGIINKDDMYTNLGLLLSDECEHTIKVAVFADETKDRFLDRKEFSGCLLKQLSDAYDYIYLNNKVSSTYEGINRLDKKDYDDLGLREALLNSIIHRDYSFDGSIIVNIYTNKIEFVSIGGLVPGINVDDIMIGISQTRNKKLANIFYRLQIVESYGTGIRKMIDDYKGLSIEPEFKVTSGAFLLTLPNRNSKEANLKDNKSTKSELSCSILNILRQRGELSRSEIQDILDVKKTSCIEALKVLQSENAIIKIGKGKKIKYATWDGSRLSH